MPFFTSLAERFRTFTQPAPRPALTLELALPRLVPKVRPRFHYEAMVLRGGAAPVFRPLAGSFGLSLVADGPDWERDLGPSDLAAWGADFDVLLQKARANLLLRGGAERFRELRPGLFRSAWQDGLDGSRALLPGLLKSLAIQGDPVVVLPNADTLLVAGADDPQALAWLLEGALEFLGEDRRSVNACPLRLRNFQWEPWAAEAGQPGAAQVQRLHRRRLQEEYGRQKALLDRRHGRGATPVAVAPFHLGRGPAGTLASSTFLPSAAEEGWLPEADRVGLLGGAGGHRTCHWIPWETARTRLGSLLEPMGLFPERYRIRAMPGQELLVSLLETGVAVSAG